MQNIITNNPNNQVVLLELADCSKSAGRFDLAMDAYEKVLHQNPTHKYARTQYINLLLMMDKYPKAKQLCEEALVNDSSAIYLRLMAQEFD